MMVHSILRQLSDPIFNDNLIEMLEISKDRPGHINTPASKKRKKNA